MGVPENFRGGPAVKYWVLEPLLMQRLDGTIQPWLAESYEWSNNYTTLTLHLRKGVTFHDGTPFNAEAVDWNIKKRMEARLAGSAEIESTEIIDEYTYAFHLKEYQNIWIDYICSEAQAHFSVMISPTAYETNGEEWANWNPVGTGPYKFVQYKENEFLELTRNDDYWGPRPHFDGVKTTYIADFVTAQMAFEAGEAETLFATGHGKDVLVDLMAKDEGYWTLPSWGLCYNLMVPGNKPTSIFYDKRIREALEYAIDKRKVVEGLYQGYALPAYQCCLSCQLPYDPNFKGREYDPDKARQLLADAGYPNGFKTTFYCQPFLYGKDVDAVQAYLKNVGIDCDLEIISVPKWIDMETNGWEEGILLFPTGPESFRGQVARDWVRPTEPNWSRGVCYDTTYRPDELEELCQKYFRIRDPVEEKAVADQIVQLIYDEAIVTPLWEQTAGSPYQPWLKCTDTTKEWLMGAIGGIPFERFWLDK
jgi:peptide/nickel transport system substrate-binding protein